MLKKISSILLIFCFLIFSLAACAMPNSKKATEEKIEKIEVEPLDLKRLAVIEPYHDLVLDIDSKEFINKGYAVGDIVKLSFIDDDDITYEMSAPVCDYYNQVNRDDTAIVIDQEKVKIAMHNLDGEGFTDIYDVKNDDIVYHIKMEKKAGYDINKFMIDTFDFEEMTSVNKSKEMLKQYDNLYIVCKGIASEDLDMNFYVTKDYVMVKTNKSEYFLDGNKEIRFKNGNKVSEVTLTEYNDRFNTDILHFESEEVIDKKIEGNNLIIRTSSTDLKELPKLHILAIDSYMNDGPSDNLRIEKNYIFDKNTRRLISYDSFLCKNDKQDLYLQKVSAILSNIKMPNYCEDIIKYMNEYEATPSNARENVVIIKASASDTSPAPYNQETISSKNKEEASASNQVIASDSTINAQ